MTSQCPYCGQPVRAGAAFCANCGHTLPTTQSLLTTPIEPGTELKARYAVTRRLGGGGSGDVYLANDKGLFNRQVVIKRLKIIDTDPQERIEAERNFVREAEALAGLNNPHFPQILDFFVDGPSQYLVMEYVAGDDLNKVIERAPRPLPQAEVISYGLQIAELLVYLHNRAEPIVHRDIKPGNIIVNQAKQATLIDFGIARSKPRPGGGGALDPRDSAAWGTPGYAPPEQVAGLTVPASDVYALGATLHHLATKRDPRDHVGEPFPAARRLNPEVGQAFSDLLDRMLAEDPRARPTADVLLAQMRQVADSARLALATDTLPPTGPLPYGPPQPGGGMAPPGRPAVALALGGMAVTSVPMLVALADRNWEEARRRLYSGEIANWLRAVGENQLAEQAHATVIHTQDHDMGLESFLHRADPALPQPRLELMPATINAGDLGRSGRRREQWRARNAGRGALVARVRGQSSWVQVSPSVVTLRAGQTVTGTVDITRPPVPGPQVSSILADAGPAGQAGIEIHAVTHVGQARQGGMPCAVRFILMLLLIGAVVLAFYFVSQGIDLPGLLGGQASGAPTATLAPAIIASPVADTTPLPPGDGSWPAAGMDAGRSYFNPFETGVPAGVAWRVALPGSGAPVSQLLVSPDRIYAASGAILSIGLMSRALSWSTADVTAAGELSIAGNLLLVPAAGELVALNTGDGTVAWRQPLRGTPAGSPLVAGDRVYQAAGDTLFSFLLADGSGARELAGAPGAQLSQAALLAGAPVSSAADGVIYRWQPDGQGVTTSTITVDGVTLSGASPVGVMSDTIFFSAGAGDGRRAVAVRADGTLSWAAPLPGSSAAAPALAEGVAFFTTSSSVIALNARDGSPAWAEADLGDLTTARGATLVPEPPSISGRLIYVSTTNGVVVALRRDDGLEAERLVVRRGGGALIHNPIPASKMIFVPGSDRQVYAIETKP